MCVFGCGYGFVPCDDAAIWWQVRRLFVIVPPVLTTAVATVSDADPVNHVVVTQIHHPPRILFSFGLGARVVKAAVYVK